jgi:hypothetical protein
MMNGFGSTPKPMAVEMAMGSKSVAVESSGDIGVNLFHFDHILNAFLVKLGLELRYFLF